MANIQDLYAKPVIWILEDGLALVRKLQPETRQFGYHLCIGGGVVNAGSSQKDLDLFFLPLDNPEKESDPTALKAWLETLWGVSEDIIGEQYLKDSGSPCDNKIKFQCDAKRIDVFIVGRRTAVA